MGERVEVLYYMDDLKASVTDIHIAQTIHGIVKRFAACVGMVINTKKSAIQFNVETPLPESLREIPRMDETTDEYLGFEMKKGEVERKEMMRKLEEWIKEKQEEPTKRVEVFEAKKLDPLHQPERDECDPVLQRTSQVHAGVA